MKETKEQKKYKNYFAAATTQWHKNKFRARSSNSILWRHSLKCSCTDYQWRVRCIRLLMLHRCCCRCQAQHHCYHWRLHHPHVALHQRPDAVPAVKHWMHADAADRGILDQLAANCARSAMWDPNGSRLAPEKRRVLAPVAVRFRLSLDEHLDS